MIEIENIGNEFGPAVRTIPVIEVNGQEYELVLTHPDQPRELISPETLELLTTPSDIAGFKDAIMAAISKGLERNIVSETPVEKP